jgi:hypothetical protein
MIIPEAALARFSEVIPQFLNAEDLAGFPFDGLSAVLPEHLQDLPRAADNVIWVVGVVYQDTVMVNAERIIGWRLTQWQPIIASKHARRANRERGKRVRQFGRLQFACGKAYVPATEDAADGIGEQVSDKLSGVYYGLNFCLFICRVNVWLFVADLWERLAEAFFDGTSIATVDAIKAEGNIVDLVLMFNQLLFCLS